MKQKAILVLGVGRSGTTAIYSLLQRILEDNFPGNMDYVYEPFLWNRTVFNKIRTSVYDEFRYVSSLSIEGIYHHKQIPMLVTDETRIEETSRNWLLKTLTPQDGKRQYLGKMIRANGRIGPIRELAPEMKIIFVIRNPLDVLNSARQLFSFYGCEFYESDFERFESEVLREFGEDIQPPSTELSDIHREFSYWLFSNRFFLNYARRHPENILTIAHEAFVNERSEVVQRICDFAELDFRQDFVTEAVKTVGSVRNKANALAKEEFDYVSSKLGVYDELLDSVQLAPSVPAEHLPKVNGWRESEASPQIHVFLNSYMANLELNKRDIQLEQHKNQLAQTKHQLTETAGALAAIRSSRRYRVVNWLLTPLDLMRRIFK